MIGSSGLGSCAFRYPRHNAHHYVSTILPDVCHGALGKEIASDFQDPGQPALTSGVFPRPSARFTSAPCSTR